jgi:hypothetical protein
MMRRLNGKIWLRVWGVVRRIIAALWRAISVENVWREIHISPDKHPEPTLRRFAYLRDRGVRCYLHNLTSPSGRGVSTGMVSLRVHRDDLNKAYRLLKEIKE